MLPEGSLRSAKGIAVAIADGIGSSRVSQVASAAAVRGFLDDYYATSDAWSVRRSAQRVLGATNSWLHAQTMRSDARFDKDSGYVCTFSALILKGRDVHLLHVGDARIYRAASARARAAHRRPPRPPVVGRVVSRPRAGRGPPCGDRLPLLGRRGRRGLPAGHRRRLRAPRRRGGARRAGPLRRRLRRGRAGCSQRRARAGSDDDSTVQLLRIDELPARRRSAAAAAARGPGDCRRRWRHAPASRASRSCANCT